MAIPSKQIGWGTEENLLWQISKQLEGLTGVASTITGGTGSSGSSGTSGGSGTSGSAGTAGLSGSSGSSGITGTSGLSGDRYKTTSNTSFTLGNPGTITVGTGLSYTPAQDVLITYNVGNHQVCDVTTYDPVTGVLVFGAPTQTIGSGTYTAWTVNLNGAAGGDGSSGTSGSSGVAGTSGIAGTSGNTGTSGSAGTSGATGTNGSSGTSASSGTAGIAGTAGTSGTSSSPATSYGLFAQTSLSVPVVVASGEASLIGTGVGTLSVPPNAFSVGDSFVARMCGTLSCANNEDIHIRVRSNGIVIADAGIFRLAITTAKFWELSFNFTIYAIGAATVASLSSNGVFTYNKNANSAIDGVNFGQVNSVTFDTTILNTLTITAEWITTSGTNTIQSQNFVLNKAY